MILPVSFATWGLTPDLLQSLRALGVEPRPWNGDALEGDCVALCVDARRGPPPSEPTGGWPVLAIYAENAPMWATFAIQARDLARDLGPAVTAAAALGASRQATRRERAIVSELVDLVCHDLRNPLAAIRANLSMLATSAADPGSAEAIGDCMLASDGALRIVENLGLAARIEAGHTRPDRGPSDVRSAVEEAVRRARGASDASSIPIVLDAPEGALPCTVSGPTLVALLDNLVAVALRYAPRGTDVRIRIERRERAVRVALSEAAPPVPPEISVRLFDRAFQVESKKVAAGRYGRGLGLYVVGLLASTCEATVACSSEDARTVYELELPLAASEPA